MRVDVHFLPVAAAKGRTILVRHPQQIVYR